MNMLNLAFAVVLVLLAYILYNKHVRPDWDKLSELTTCSLLFVLVFCILLFTQKITFDVLMAQYLKTALIVYVIAVWLDIWKMRDFKDPKNKIGAAVASTIVLYLFIIYVAIEAKEWMVLS